MLLGKKIITEKTGATFANKSDVISLEYVADAITHFNCNNPELVNMAKKLHLYKGSVSDGYHTFDELYHHRAILFSVICDLYPELAWKSKQHDDPNFPMYPGMFICGIETPGGQATYHYDIDPYWDIFNVKELERAPKYDGHTPEDAINRIKLLTNR